MFGSSGYRRCFTLLILSTLVISLTFFSIHLNAGTKVWSHFEPMARELGLNQSSTDMSGTTKPEQTNLTSESLLTNDSVQFIEVEHGKYEKVFMIVAYRDREENKEVFVKEMNSYLTRKECQLRENSLIEEYI